MDTEQKDKPVAEDDESQGRLQIRGHWVIDDYLLKIKMPLLQVAGLIPEISPRLMAMVI